MEVDDPILQKCHEVIGSLYGERLKALILYGSCARGQDEPESDIDLMVLLNGPVNVAREIRRICDVLYQVQLECDQVISVMPADVELYRRGEYNLYRNVLEEGVTV